MSREAGNIWKLSFVKNYFEQTDVVRSGLRHRPLSYGNFPTLSATTPLPACAHVCTSPLKTLSPFADSPKPAFAAAAGMPSPPTSPAYEGSACTSWIGARFPDFSPHVISISNSNGGSSTNKIKQVLTECVLASHS